jgi:hypothetical protein
VFYTNAESRKGGEISANPRGNAVPLEVAAPAGAHRRAAGEKQARRWPAYFASRHPDSRLGSAASERSCARLAPDHHLDRVEHLRGRYPGGEVPRPTHWTGFRLIPERIEFWLARPHGCTNGGCSPRRRRLDQHAALPVTDGDPRRAFLTQRRVASIAMALFLGVLKSWAAWRTGSTAMLGSLADTALDLVASLVTLAGVWIAARPADETHRFGHGKPEALAAMFQVILIVLSAAGIGFRAITASSAAGEPMRRPKGSASRWSRSSRRSRCSPGNAT